MSEPSILKMCELLRRAAQDEGTETGEYWQAISSHGHQYGSEKYVAAWKQEVRDAYDEYKSSWSWVRRERTVVRQEYLELVWNDDLEEDDEIVEYP